MATLTIDTFGGMIPRLHPTLLPDTAAITAHNLKLKSGKIVPLKQPSQRTTNDIWLENGLTDIKQAKTIHPWRYRLSDGTEKLVFLAWPGEVDVAAGNLADDDYDRIFVSGKTGIPYVQGTTNNEPAVYLHNRTDDTIIRRTLVKTALPAPVATRVGGILNDISNAFYTFFFQTWVDKYGYESPVSDKSDEVVYNNGDTINIGAVTQPTGAVTRRIYKVISGTETEAIQFVAEFSDAAAFGARDITVNDADAGETLMAIRNPPNDLTNMLRMYGRSNFYAAFAPSAPKTVLFSELDIPYSWPTAYRFDISANIVALASTASSLIVLTDGAPFVFTGTEPEAMVSAPLSPAACVAKRSVCRYNNNVYYAGNDGICIVYNDAYAGTVVKNLTEKIYTKDQWRAFNPASCRMTQHDGALHAFFTVQNGATTVEKAIVLSLDEQTPVLTTHDESAACTAEDAETDDLYFVRTTTTEVTA